MGVATRVRSSMNEFQGGQSAEALREKLSSPLLGALEKMQLQRKLSRELLKTGELPEALEWADAALQGALSAGLTRELASLYKLQGIAHLREAERENCIARHNAACCIFPLEGDAQHSVKAPAEQAYANFLKCLEHDAEDLEARWLLNLCAMALDRHPDQLPAAYLIDPHALDSETKLGRFQDVAESCGLDSFNLCGGCVVEDFDGDGLLDVVTSTYDFDGPMTFHRNLGDGDFEDRTRAAGLSHQLGGLNVISADYDNDGDADLLVLRGAWLYDQGQIRNSLLQNDGQGNFLDVTHSAGLALPARPTQAAVFVDLDDDGLLDLYVVNESRREMEAQVGAPGDYPSQYFHNNGDGSFSDLTREAGLENNRYAKGVSAGDFDNDGDQDLYVSNIGLNRLYRNNGDGTFDDLALELDLVAPRRSFATWFFDFDNDGWLDIFVGAYRASIANVALDYLGQDHGAARPRLYLNDRAGGFREVGLEAGLDHAWLPMGANFGDLDNDGWLDIYLATGDPKYESLMPNVLLRNRGGKTLENVTQSSGLGHLQKGHGVAIADIDNDGDQDLFHQLGGFYQDDKYRNALFLNPGNQANSLVLQFEGASSNRAGYGVRLRLVLEDAAGVQRELHRAVGSLSSFGGSPRRQEIGLGQAPKIKSLEVLWPTSKKRQLFEGLEPNRSYLIKEAAQEPIEVPRRPFKIPLDAEAGS